MPKRGPKNGIQAQQDGQISSRNDSSREGIITLFQVRYVSFVSFFNNLLLHQDFLFVIPMQGSCSFWAICRHLLQ